nr:hypothetical protein [uncultured bacterium]
MPGGFRLSAAPPPQADAINCSWPAFSSTVIFPIRRSTKAGTSTRPAVWRSARAGLESQAAAAPALIKRARRETAKSCMKFPLNRARTERNSLHISTNFSCT